MAKIGNKTESDLGITKNQIEKNRGYYFEYNKDTNVTSVISYRKSTNVGGSRANPRGTETIATYSPETGFKFTKDITEKEEEYFRKPKSREKIKDEAKKLIESDLITEGATKDEAKKRATESIEGKGNLTYESPEEKTINEGLSVVQKAAEGIARREYENLIYPKTLNTKTQDIIRFTLQELKSIKYNASLQAEPFKRQYSGTDLKGSVTLPIQSGITDSNLVKWGPNELDAISGFAAGASLNLMNSKSGEDFVGKLGDIIAGAQKDVFNKSEGDFKPAILAALAGKAVGIQGLLSRATGTVLNPNLELLFQGPQLRPFTFQFRLSPRGIEEAKDVKKIIRFFKQAMSVKKITAGNAFLKTPFVFNIAYQTTIGDELKDHPSLSKIKTCALLGCDVDYTPDGTYSTFNDPDKTMTSYNLTLRFNELEPIFDTDYTELDEIQKNSNMIGY